MKSTLLRSGCGGVAMLVWLTGTSPAQAQINPPSTPTGGVFGERAAVDPRRVSQELSVLFAVGTGFDQNPPPVEGVILPPGSFGPLQSGSITAAQATSRYRWGRASRFVEVAGHGYSSYASAGVDQLTGGDASLNVETELGPRTGLVGQAEAAYQPAFLFNAFGPIADQIDGVSTPETAPSQGITEQRFLSLQATGGLYRQWTTRQRTDFRLGGSSQRPMRGPGLDNLVRSASVVHEWLATRTAGLQASYSFSDNQQRFDLAPAQTLSSHDFRGGIRLQRRVSASRTFSLGFGGGVIRSRTSLVGDAGKSEFFVPTGYLTARLDLARSWSLSSNLNRDVGVLAGLSPEPFETTAVSLRLEGNVARRLQVVVDGALARGGALTTRQGSFESGVGSVQLQFAASRTVGLFTGYTYYDHRLVGLQVVQPGFPTRYERNAVRIGLSVWLPVFGIR